MKKILSFILAAAMIVGMMSFVSGAETPNQMLKFSDILGKGEGGDLGMMNYLGTGTSNQGFTIAMDFIYGASGICYHPIDATLKHQSKFAILLGESSGNYKYVGYSATDDVFFFGHCANPPMYGEGTDGIVYYATSEKGLIVPGELNKVAYEFKGDICKIYLNGEEIVTFDLYEDLRYPEVFPGINFMVYPTHITCFVDNFAVYAVDTYNAETGEELAPAASFTNFDDDAQMVEEDVVDAEGNVTGKKTVVKSQDWQIVNSVYSLATIENDVYAQPQYIPAEDEVNVIFQSGLDRTLEGHEDEVFATGKDFNVDLTIKNNKGLDSLVLDLVNDPYITVKSVEAAEGLTAILGETDADGVTKLTITGDKYTGEALATITYTMSDKAVQDISYSYGAKYLCEISGAEGMEDCIVTNGRSKIFNFIVGDLNGDFKFNMDDVTIILQIAAKWTIDGVFKEAGDVNADGRTNVMDATYYLKWIAKWKYDFTINGITYM